MVDKEKEELTNKINALTEQFTAAQTKAEELEKKFTAAEVSRAEEARKAAETLAKYEQLATDYNTLLDGQNKEKEKTIDELIEEAVVERRKLR